MQINRKVRIIFVLFLFGVFLVSALTISSFDDYGVAGNISLSANTNKTINLTINKDAVIYSAFLNLSGFEGMEVQLDANDKGVVNNTNIGSLHVNYTKKGIGANWTVKHGHWNNATRCQPEYNISIPSDCWNYNENVLVLKMDSSTYYSQPYCMNLSGWKAVGENHSLGEVGGNGGYASELHYNLFWDNSTTTGTRWHNQKWYISNCNSNFGGGGTIAEETIHWTMGNITNPFLRINNTEVWSHNGRFNSTYSPNRTDNFSLILNSALNSSSCDCNGCVLDGNNCTIPLTLFSQTDGMIELSALNINWSESLNPNVIIFSPTGAQTSLTISYNVSISDNNEKDTCIYWVTRGASTEISNTSVSCDLANGSFIVSSDNTNYVFHFWANDTAGNINKTNSSFSTSQGATTGGGGGAQPQEEEVEEVSLGCSIYRAPLKEAWEDFFNNTNGENFIENFLILWDAFWDRALCDSASSIVPIQ